MRWHERLGFGKDQVVLIIHADDAGLTQSHNDAIADCHATGLLTSASVLIDGFWSKQFLDAQAGTSLDVGIHMALGNNVISNLERVEMQLSRQFDKMILDRRPTHMDAHGGVIFMSEVSTGSYARFSTQNAIPALLSANERMITKYPAVLGVLEKYPYPMMDDVLMAPARLSLDDKQGWVLNRLGGLKPGIYQWIVHPSETDIGQADSWILKGVQLKRLLRRRRFVLTNWLEIWNRYLNA